MDVPHAIEIRHLRAFLLVAETENFTRAAERLGISQPSVSVQIRDLEAALGAPLFARLGQRVALTPAGRVFRQRAELVLSKLNDACQAVRQTEDLTAGHLSVGVIPPLHVPWIPRVLGRLQREHPGLALSVTEKSSPEVEHEVESGRFDVGVCILSHSSPNLTYEPLQQDSIVLLGRADGPLSRRRKVSAQELSELPLVLLPESYLLRQLTQEAFRRARVLPRVALEVDTIEGVLTTAVETGLATLMPRVVLQGRAALGLCAVPLSEWEQRLEFGLVWPGSVERNAAACAFAEALRATVAER